MSLFTPIATALSTRWPFRPFWRVFEAGRPRASALQAHAEHRVWPDLLAMHAALHYQLFDRLRSTDAARNESVVVDEVASFAHLIPHRVLAVLHGRIGITVDVGQSKRAHGLEQDRQRVLEPALDEDQIVEPRLVREVTDFFDIGAAKIARFHPVDISGFRHALKGVERINFSARVELLQAPSHENCATAAIRSELDDVL